jgi:hypothetical protein
MRLVMAKTDQGGLQRRKKFVLSGHKAEGKGGASHRARSLVWTLGIAFTMAFGGVPRLVAQSSANLDGVVHDPLGAVVPQAKVELKNTATGKILAATSNGSGVFSFSGLDTGDYTLTVVAAGFEKGEYPGIHLDPGDQRTLRDISLRIGKETVSVTVTDEQGQVSTDSGETSTLISADDIDHLAVEGRDVTELLKILPGMAVVQNGTTFANAAQTDPSLVTFGGVIGNYAANGTQVNSTALLTDGMDITDPGSYGSSLQNVNYDQVAEVKVQTGSFATDSAHGPVVINAIGKSGGNAFHGSLYTYGRTYQLNSLDWIAKYSKTTTPQDRQIYPGFTIGGPVLFPKLDFNHSKKLTFFAGAEEYAQRKVYAYNNAYSATVSAFVPTPGMRKGDFSSPQIQQMLGPSIDSTDTGTQDGNGNEIYSCPNSLYSRICTPPAQGPLGNQQEQIKNGNISAYIDPLGQAIFNSFPLPNVVPGNGAYNYIATDFVNNNLFQAKARLDDAISEKTHAFLAYSMETGQQYNPSGQYYRSGPNGMGGGMDTPGGGFIGTATSHVASVELTTVISPSMTNQFYAGGARFFQEFTLRTPSAVEGEPYSLLFNNGSKALPSLQTYGSSNFDGFPFATVEDPTYGNDFTAKQLRLAGDNFTKLIQRHTLRGGVFYQWVDNPQLPGGQNTNGSLTDYYHPAQQNDSSGAGFYTTGNYTADILEGLIGGISQVNKKVETNLYFYTLAGYLQDHWLATRHMSIDAGVRLEHFTPWIDPHGLGVAVFDPKAYASGAPLASPGVLYHAIDSSVPNTGVPSRPAFVEPRFGFVYDFRGDSKTILRAGYGIYRQHDSYSDGLLSAQTAEGQRSYTETRSGWRLSNLYLDQTKITAAASGFVVDSTINTRWFGDDEQSRVQTYNVALDQRLPAHMVFELGYVGNYGDHLMEANNLRNINAMPYGTLFGPQPDAGRPDTASTVGTVWPVFAPVSNPSNGNLANLTTADTDSFRPYPLYSGINAIRHRGYSNYNGLQARYQWTLKRANVNANYAWSKALGAVAGPDPVTLSNDYLPLSIDRTHILNFTYAYPFGKMVRERYLGWVINDWEIAGITNYQSGTLLQSLIGSNFDLSGSLTIPVGTVASIPGYNNTSSCAVSGTVNTCNIQITSSSVFGTPDISLQPTIVQSPQGHGNHQYVNGAAFRLPGLASNGPIYYGDLRGPAFFNSDLSLRKEFAVHEGQTLQFRLAAFNFLNYANHTFSALYPGGYELTFTGNSTATDLSADLRSATNTNTSFGLAPIRTGRRVMEMSVKYAF